MKPIGSEITTSLGEASSGTGMLRGGHGLPTHAGSPETVRWLAQRSPAEVDTAALWRASQLGAELKLRHESRFPSGPNGERLPSYSVVVGCDVEGSEADRRRAVMALQATLSKTPEAMVEAWLAELSVLVARRPGDEFSEELRLTAYAKRLADYPADVVRHVLIKRTWKFWPTWEELHKACEEAVRPRRAMAAALLAPPPSVNDRPIPTPEERARIAALVSEAAEEMRLKHAEAEKVVAKPHWSHTAAPDDHRWRALRRARAANPLITPEGDAGRG